MGIKRLRVKGEESNIMEVREGFTKKGGEGGGLVCCCSRQTVTTQAL